MTRNAPTPRPSSSSQTGKRSKRPRSTSDQRCSIGSDESDEQQDNSQRLYHGACPDVSNRYRKVGGGRIGQGTYGVVYCARDVWEKQKTNEIVALKKCHAHHEASDGFPITTLREIQALRICSSHPNIVDLLEIAVSSNNKKSSTLDTNCNNNSSKNMEDTNDSEKKDEQTAKESTSTLKSRITIGKSNVFLVFEHCRYDLAHIIDSYHEHRRKKHRRGSSLSPFSLPETKTLVLQLLSALEFCHSHWLVHRDIKPSNLLYDTITGRLKLCDFGLSRIASETNVHMTPNVVSLWYRAPELLLLSSKKDRFRYSFPIDMWATGCVVAELLKGRPLLDGSSEMEQLEKMEDALGPPPSDLYSLPPTKSKKRQSMDLWDRFEYLPAEGLTLLIRLLDYDPDARWTAAAASGADFLAANSQPPPIEDLRSMPKSFPGC